MNASYMKQDQGTQDIVFTKITSMTVCETNKIPPHFQLPSSRKAKATVPPLCTVRLLCVG